MDTTPTRDQLARAISDAVARYVAEGLVRNAYEVNSGLCEDLGTEVAAALGGETPRFEGTWADNLTVDGQGEEWDVSLLSEISPASTPTYGLSWEEAGAAIPAHYWLMLDGRHHDSECPEGVDNLFNLPIIQRGMERVAEQSASVGPRP